MRKPEIETKVDEVLARTTPEKTLRLWLETFFRRQQKIIDDGRYCEGMRTHYLRDWFPRRVNIDFLGRQVGVRWSDEETAWKVETIEESENRLYDLEGVRLGKIPGGYSITVFPAGEDGYFMYDLASYIEPALKVLDSSFLPLDKPVDGNDWGGVFVLQKEGDGPYYLMLMAGDEDRWSLEIDGSDVRAWELFAGVTRFLSQRMGVAAEFRLAK